MSEADNCAEELAIEHIKSTLAKAQQLQDIADFKIVCDDREWDVYRFVISLHSAPLAANFTTDFKEAKDGKVVLSDDGVQSVERLIQYFYRLDYDCDYLMGHIDMCILTDKYEMPHLHALATQKFEQNWKECNVTNEDDLVTLAARAYEMRATKEVRSLLIQAAWDDDHVDDHSEGPLPSSKHLC